MMFENQCLQNFHNVFQQAQSIYELILQINYMSMFLTVYGTDFDYRFMETSNLKESLLAYIIVYLPPSNNSFFFRINNRFSPPNVWIPHSFIVGRNLSSALQLSLHKDLNELKL